MRVLAVVAAVTSLGLAAPLPAQSAAEGHATMKDCAAQWQAKKKAGTATGSYRDFSKACLAGKPAATAEESRTRPQSRMQQVGPGTASKTAPKGSNADAAGATARCKDGAYSHAKGHTGACSHHGGVAEWLK